MRRQNRFMTFVCETQARLGWVNTPFEQRLFGTYRAIKRVLLSPRRTTALVVTMLLVGGPTVPLRAQMSDAPAFAQRISQFAAKTTQEHIADLWKEANINTKWLTDLVQTYRTIKLAKTQYEALATFNLVDNISVVDLVPELELEPGNYFGGPDDGFSSETRKDGSTKDSYLSLRVRSRKGGVSSTFQNWPRFKPNLQIDPRKLIDQLANLDFDAVKMVQWYNPEGNAVGSAMLAGRPEEVAGRIGAMWDGIIKDANNWVEFRQQARDTRVNMQQQMAFEYQSFEDRANELQNKIDAEETANRQVLGLPYSTGTKSTWDAHIAPEVEQARRQMVALHAADERSLELLTATLEDMKKSNETTQSAVTSFQESGKIAAETQSILNANQEGFQKILDKYKIKRTDATEKIAGLVSSGSFKDLEGLKLPPQASEEVNRLLAASHAALLAQQMKLSMLQEKTRKIEAMDHVGAEIKNAQAKMIQLAQMTTDMDLAMAAKEAMAAANDYTAFVAAEKAQRRAEEAAATRDLVGRIRDANTVYFTVLKDRMQGPALFEAMTSTYLGFLRGFFGGKSLQDVMAVRNKSIAAVNQKTEWAAYEKCVYGSAL